MHLFMSEPMYTYVIGCSPVRFSTIKNSVEYTGEGAINLLSCDHMVTYH